MRKIYLFAIVLSLKTFSFGQELEQMPKIVKTLSQLTNKPLNYSNNKAVGSLIYSNDFDNPNDWTIDNDGQTGSEFGWTIDSVSDGWFFTLNAVTRIKSTSGGNYAELANGIDTTGGGKDGKLGVTYTMTTASPIDLFLLGGTGSENSVLEFEQTGARFNDVQEVLISTNGTDFTKIGDNSGEPQLSPAGILSRYANPDIKYIDLAPFLTPTTIQTVWIRFRWTTNFPSPPMGSEQINWVTYGWAIDDLKIRTKPDNAIRVDSSDWGSNFVKYYTIPTTQVAPITFSTGVTNTGLNDGSNVVLNVNITGAATTSVSGPTKNIAAGAKETLITDPYVTPAVVGRYEFSMEVTSDSIEDTPTDNVVARNSFEVVPAEGVYARDTYSRVTGNVGGYDTRVTPPLEDFEAGNLYDIFQDQKVGGIDVFVGTDSKAGCVIDVVLYQYNPNGGSFDQQYTLIERSKSYKVEAQDIGQIVSLKLTDQPELKAGTAYFAAVHGWGSNGGTIPPFYFGTSGTSPGVDGPIGETSRIYYPSMPNPTKNYFELRTPMVRLNFDLTVGIDDAIGNLIEFNIYPNPSKGIFNIDLQSKVTEKSNLIVKNSLGQTVLNRTIEVTNQTNETIDLSDYSRGIYFLTIQNKTVKLIIN